MFQRDLQSLILDQCFKQKAIILLGARQVGKTTLLKKIIQEHEDRVLYLNCDEPQTVAALANRNLKELQLIIGANKFVVIDEAQKVDNIGLTLKIIVDNMPDIQVIATGSSAFELRNRLNEPLTGRKIEYQMFPISTNEIYKTSGYMDIQRMLEPRLIYGSYPDILNQSADTQMLLRNLTDSYLYKDILATENLRKPDLLDKLLRALAYQVGSEVSYNELAQTVGSDSKTVEKYIELLEKCFIIFRLNGLSRNLRNELKKAKKIYFYDYKNWGAVKSYTWKNGDDIDSWPGNTMEAWEGHPGWFVAEVEAIAVNVIFNNGNDLIMPRIRKSCNSKSPDHPAGTCCLFRDFRHLDGGDLRLIRLSDGAVAVGHRGVGAGRGQRAGLNGNAGAGAAQQNFSIHMLK